MDLFIPKFIKYQLYLLQLENYELGRYWKLLIKKGFFPRKKNPQRKELVWTAKAYALLLMAFALHNLAVVFAGILALATHKGSDGIVGFLILVWLACLPFYFLWFNLALILIGPLDALAKKNIVSKARAKLEKLDKIKVIGVAGSYGKTTMKEVLHQVLGSRFKVLATPESVNTPVGIGRWVLNKVTEETQIIIVEMGEHYENDIKEICEIAKPDICLVTGINESHLERMGKMETVIATIFEIVSNSKQGATVVLNAEDHNVMENYQKFVWPDHRVQEFRIRNLELRIFDVEKLCWEAEAEGVGKIEVNLLGEYALGDVDAAIKIGKSLGMSGEEIKRGIQNIKPVEHRLQPIKSAGDVLVIDDAYNGNPDGVREAIKVLSRFTNRRKIYITPGLVEMGRSAAEIHREIGRQLASLADIVILIKNSVTPWIAEGLSSSGVILRPQISNSSAAEESHPSKEVLHPSPIRPPQADQGALSSVEQAAALSVQDNAKKKAEIIWYNDALVAHAELKNILKPGDVILFQNDWGDQYI